MVALDWLCHLHRADDQTNPPNVCRCFQLCSVVHGYDPDSDHIENVDFQLLSVFITSYSRDCALSWVDVLH